MAPWSTRGRESSRSERPAVSVDLSLPPDRPALDHARFVPELTRYLRTETVGGAILLAAAAVALIWANSPWRRATSRCATRSSVPSALHLDLTLADWAKDGLLAVFFFVAGPRAQTRVRRR